MRRDIFKMWSLNTKATYRITENDVENPYCTVLFNFELIVNIAWLLNRFT